MYLKYIIGLRSFTNAILRKLFSFFQIYIHRYKLLHHTSIVLPFHEILKLCAVNKLYITIILYNTRILYMYIILITCLCVNGKL